jgi:hypothetical protein
MDKIYADPSVTPKGYSELLGYVLLSFLHARESADELVGFMKTAFQKLHTEHSKSQLTSAMSVADFAEYYFTQVERVTATTEAKSTNADAETQQAQKDAKGKAVHLLMVPFSNEVIRYAPKDVLEFGYQYFEALGDGEDPLSVFLMQQAEHETRPALA